MESAKNLEIHYYFKDNSHSMDAFVRNKCETEILAIAKEIASTLGVKIKIESLAYDEGGLRDIWKIIGVNNTQIAIVVSVLALILSQMPKTDAETEQLQKELLKFSVEEKRLQVQKLKRELANEFPNDSTINKAARIIEQDYKIVTRKSNFYKKISHYDKVEKLGVNIRDQENNPLQEEIVIPKENFKRCILASNILPSIVDEKADIEIVAPVLKESNAHWKGMYKDEPISFSMSDKDFKEAVLNKTVSFKSGTNIICVLKVRRKLDEVGEVVITGYKVDTVLEKNDTGLFEETAQGKQYRYETKMRDSQQELFNEIEPTSA